MSRLERLVWWSADPNDHPGGSWIVVSEKGFLERDSRILGRHNLPGPVPDWAEDLLRVARAIFLADKHVRRDLSDDRWTRHIHLSVPVSDPDRWQATDSLTHLTALLQTLTADIWEVVFRPLPRRPVQEALPDDNRASEVALFSGGLDSLSWAATRASAKDPLPLLLVTFREISLLRLQRQAYEAVKHLSRGARPVFLQPMSQTPTGDGARTRLETSSRSRGLFYAASAVRAAAAHEVPVVHVPENGQLALNPPLTPARAAACSTRSMHPWTLHHLNGLIDAISDHEQTVRVINPLARLTKGQVCRAALDAGLSPSDLEATLSCGKPPVRRRNGARVPNCGTCFPCLVRRSGLIHASGADNTEYELRPWANGLSAARAADWCALRRWLSVPYTLYDLLADTPLPPGTDAGAALNVIAKGRMELRGLPRLVGGAV